MPPGAWRENCFGYTVERGKGKTVHRLAVHCLAVLCSSIHSHAKSANESQINYKKVNYSALKSVDGTGVHASAPAYPRHRELSGKEHCKSLDKGMPNCKRSSSVPRDQWRDKHSPMPRTNSLHSFLLFCQCLLSALNCKQLLISGEFFVLSNQFFACVHYPRSVYLIETCLGREGH